MTTAKIDHVHITSHSSGAKAQLAILLEPIKPCTRLSNWGPAHVFSLFYFFLMSTKFALMKDDGCMGRNEQKPQYTSRLHSRKLANHAPPNRFFWFFVFFAYLVRFKLHKLLFSHGFDEYGGSPICRVAAVSSLLWVSRSWISPQR